MPLIINNLSFSGNITTEKYIAMVNEIKKLPKPKVTQLDNSEANDKNTILCLEREMAHVKMHLIPNIKYIGTKNVFQCIFINIYSSTDHLTIHVDTFDTSKGESFEKIEKIIDNFEDKKIKIAMIGGSKSKGSIYNLLNILNMLSNIAEKKNLDFIFEYQAILENNIFEQDDRYTCIYNLMIEKLDILSRQYFQKSLDKDFIASVKVSDLINKHTECDDNLVRFCDATIYAEEVHRNSNKCFMIELESKMIKIIKNEADFINMAIRLFTAQSFQLFDNAYKLVDYYPSVKYINFAFNIDTHDISIIKKCHYTPDEIIRHIYLVDCYREHNSYFLSYNQNTYLIPTLSDQFIQYCRELESDVSSGFTSRELGELLPKDGLHHYTENLNTRNAVFKLVKLQMKNKPQQPSKNSLSLFTQLNPFIIYKQGVIEYNNKQYIAARSLFKQALTIFNEKPNTYSEQGKCYYSLSSVQYKVKNMKEAIMYCEKAMECFYLDKNTENMKDAEKKYQVYLTENQSDPANLYSNAITLYKEKCNYLALQQLLFSAGEFNKTEKYNQCATTHSSIASCYRELGNTELAIEHCDLAIDILNNNKIKIGLADIQSKKDKLLSKGSSLSKT